jgi:hypothetical protein
LATSITAGNHYKGESAYLVFAENAENDTDDHRVQYRESTLESTNNVSPTSQKRVEARKQANVAKPDEF